MSKQKLIFMTTGVILAMALIVISLFFFLSKEKKTGRGDGTQTGTDRSVGDKDDKANNLSGVGGDVAKIEQEPRLKEITNEAVVKMAIKNEKILIFTKKGRIFELNLDGQGVKELRKENSELISVLISSDLSNAILTEFDNTGKLSYTIINLSSYQEFKFPENIFSPVFSLDGKQIAFHYYDSVGGVNAIATSPIDAFKINVVFSLNMYQINLFWAEENNIYISHNPSYVIKDTLYKLDIKNKELSRSNILGNGLIIKTIPKNILYSTVDKNGKNLNLFVDDFSRSLNLGLRILASKCVSFDDNNLICARDSNDPLGSWPDDYYKLKISLADEFIKVNIKTNEISVVAGLTDLAAELDATELVSTDKYLFFVDRKDGKLYRLTL